MSRQVTLLYRRIEKAKIKKRKREAAEKSDALQPSANKKQRVVVAVKRNEETLFEVLPSEILSLIFAPLSDRAKAAVSRTFSHAAKFVSAPKRSNRSLALEAAEEGEWSLSVDLNGDAAFPCNGKEIFEALMVGGKSSVIRNFLTPADYTAGGLQRAGRRGQAEASEFLRSLVDQKAFPANVLGRFEAALEMGYLEGGHTHLLSPSGSALSKGFPSLGLERLEAAIASGSESSVGFCIQQGIRFDGEALYRLAAHGHMMAACVLLHLDVELRYEATVADSIRFGTPELSRHFLIRWQQTYGAFQAPEALLAAAVATSSPDDYAAIIAASLDLSGILAATSPSSLVGPHTTIEGLEFIVAQYKLKNTDVEQMVASSVQCNNFPAFGWLMVNFSEEATQACLSINWNQVLLDGILSANTRAMEAAFAHGAALNQQCLFHALVRTDGSLKPLLLLHSSGLIPRPLPFTLARLLSESEAARAKPDRVFLWLLHVEFISADDVCELVHSARPNDWAIRRLATFAANHGLLGKANVEKLKLAITAKFTE